MRNPDGKPQQHVDAEKQAGLLANLALLWLGIGIILLPTSRMLLWQLDSSFGAKSLIGLLEVVFILLVVANRRVSLSVPDIPRPVAFLAIFWFFWAALAIVLMDHRAAGLLRQAEWVAHGAFLFAMTAFFRKYPFWTEGAIRFVLISYLLICALILAIWFNHPQPTEFGWRGGFAGFTHIRLFGHFTLLTIMLSASALWSDQPLRITGNTVFLFLVSCLAWAGLFWAGGRAPFLAALIVIALATLFLKKHVSVTSMLTWFAAGALLGALLSLPFSLPEQGMGLARIFKPSEGLAGIDQYSSGRFTAWLQFARHLLGVPLFGEGPDGYLYYVAGSVWPHTVQPHNFVLQTVFEWGFPGALAFLVLLGYMLVHAIRNSLTVMDSSSGIRVAALLSVIALLLLSLLTGPLYHAWTLMLFSLGAGLSLIPETSPATDASPDSREIRGPMALLASGAGLVFAANAVVLFVALWPTPPASPASTRAQLVRIFPAPLVHPWATAALDQWPANWQLTAEETCRWYEWVGSNAGWLAPDYQARRQEILSDAGCL